MKENSSSKRQRKWWQLLLMYPTLLLALIGDIPTISDLYVSYKNDIPFAAARAAKEQDDLWKKNFECVRNQKSQGIITTHNVTVEAMVCPSGDVLLHVKAPDSKENFRWVGLDTFSVKNASANFLVRPAMASAQNTKEILAQAYTVICQRHLGEGRILRRIQYEDGQCFDEVINTYTGALISRDPAPCDSDCGE